MRKSTATKSATRSATVSSLPVPRPLSFHKDSGILLVPIRVKPNAKETKLASLLSTDTAPEHAFDMHVAAAPHDGEANLEVITLISKVLFDVWITHSHGTARVGGYEGLT
jgi:uncharacterized protein YggU (UPF0235/DUF167 family)